MIHMSPVLAVLSEWHIILALIIVFLLFGGKKLPELARGIGEAMKEFKKASRDVHGDEQHHTYTPPSQPPQDQSHSAPTQSKPSDPKLN
jgi:sec-independent protein translocase protein TatA